MLARDRAYVPVIYRLGLIKPEFAINDMII